MFYIPQTFNPLKPSEQASGFYETYLRTDKSHINNIKRAYFSLLVTIAVPERWIPNASTEISDKSRSQAIDLADLICRSFPGTKCLFLYRNAEPWFDSDMQAFGGYLSPEVIRGSWLWCKARIRMVDAYPVSDP
jgi:hypothetical protein